MMMGCINLGGYKVISFDKIPSTQTFALNMVAAGRASDHVAIVAQAQSAGRGRYRRTWVSHHGNVYASFIFNADERDPRIAYSVAVAVAETIISYGIMPQIKWPNDILIDGAKVCGILIEYAGPFVIVGIGVNIKTNPTVDAYQTTRLDKYMADISVTDFLGRLMRQLDKWMKRDFASVRARWMDLAIAIKTTVKYRGANVELIEINSDGALVLRDGAQYFLAWGDEIGT
ncbi:MAG: biotin--[acetyl-CoA-carboxylase] ligase [Alphaproteobacteria bacterium]|nr:biotin--[acetyl-CoA-carboxylase] ligase [Alphaproteobacteria bacterium]